MNEEETYYQIDPATGEILCPTIGRWDMHRLDYLRERDTDFAFFDAWRKTWPHVNPLLSELQLYRQWKKAEQAFKTVGDRLELQRRAMPDEAPSSFFAV